MDLHFVNLFVQSAAAAAVAGRLVWLKLAWRFPALFVFLVLLALSDLSLSLISLQSRLYFRIYVAEVPVYCISSIFAVRELFALVFENYPGIRTAGRWAVYTALALAGVISMFAAAANVFGQRGPQTAAAI